MLFCMLFRFILDATGCTAMHFAAGKGDIGMVDLLLAGGAIIGESRVE